MEEELFWDITLVSAIFMIISVMAYLGSIIWSYKDAKKRGIHGWIIALLVAFVAWPLSFIGWLFLRPSKKEYQHH